MILSLHGGLGDSACYTGIPEAYFKKFGEKLYIRSYYTEFWENNPYCILGAPSEPDEIHKLRFEKHGEEKDWAKYRPQRLFSEMTQSEVEYEEVQPKLYTPRDTIPRRLVVCDEANWKSRRGYQHLPKLIANLGEMNWDTFLIRNGGTETDREVFTSDHTVNFNLKDTINFIATADLYIGYDSGLAHIAAGLGVPYILILGSTPPVVMKHASCLHAAEVCQHCFTNECPHQCLANSDDKNEEIKNIIKERFD